MVGLFGLRAKLPRFGPSPGRHLSLSLKRCIEGGGVQPRTKKGRFLMGGGDERGREGRREEKDWEEEGK